MRKEERSKHGAEQHSTPKAVTFPKKNGLPRVELEPTTLYTLDRALYQLSYTLEILKYMYIYIKQKTLSHIR